MTTFEAAAAGLLRRGSDRIAARAARRANRATIAKTAGTIATRTRRLTLQAGALAAFTYAAWTVTEALGLVIGGVSAFVLDWLLSE